MSKATESTILAAAKQVFLREGYGGARMQTIADTAGINKALVHYYFRSKEQLFERIFQDVFQVFTQGMEVLNNRELTLLQKLEQFVVYFTQATSQEPELIQFVLLKAPDKLEEVFRELNLNDSDFAHQLQEGQRLGLLQPKDPRVVLITLFSLCLFPLQARSMLSSGLDLSDETQRYEVLHDYYREVPNLVMTHLRV